MQAKPDQARQDLTVDQAAVTSITCNPFIRGFIEKQSFDA